VAKAIGNVQPMNQVALHWQMLGFYIPPFEQGAVMIFWNSTKNDFTQHVMND
jgi:hypothetical protein